MDDLDIVELYHRRDERAISESDRKYGAMCRSISERLLGVREDAEECVNDTWLAAWNSMPPERPRSLGAFLGRITRNLSVSRWRRDHAGKRYDGLDVMLSELEDCIPSPESVEFTIERRLLGELISEWLDGLDEQSRAQFVRRYWYGDTVKELAAAAGERANTCSQRLSRLRCGLREFLESKGTEL